MNESRDLLSYIGDAYAAMNRHSDALPIYQEGLNLARTAVKEKPEVTELKRDLGIWLSLVMNAHLQLNDPAAAIEPSLEAVELNRTLMKIDANDVRAKTDYVETLCDAGSALSRVSRFEEADKLFKDALSVLVPIVTSDPSNSLTKELLAMAHQKYGDLFSIWSQLDRALNHYLESQQLFDQLVKAKPLNVLWRQK